MSHSPRRILPPVHIGERAGTRMVISISRGARHQVMLTLECACGAHAITNVSQFRRVPPMRCKVCQPNRRTHGATGTPEYTCWQRMLSRCYQPSHHTYKYYGGRGITVCPQWRSSFETFLRDVGSRPSDDVSLDRIDVNGHYEPGNVRWASRLVQSQNRRLRGKKAQG